MQTYRQSGNAVVSAPGTAAALAQQVAAAIEADLGMAVKVMVRTADELDQVIAENPLEVHDRKMFHIGFLSGKVAAARLDAVDDAVLLPDRLVVGDRVAYLAYADASQRGSLAKIKLGVDMTARNWRTVLALQRLSRA